MLKSLKLAVGVACLVTLLGGLNFVGQGMFATLTGVVSDSTGAIVKGAKVTLIDSVSGPYAKPKTNSDGYYTFPRFRLGKYRHFH